MVVRKRSNCWQSDEEQEAEEGGGSKATNEPLGVYHHDSKP